MLIAQRGRLPFWDDHHALLWAQSPFKYDGDVRQDFSTSRKTTELFDHSKKNFLRSIAKLKALLFCDEPSRSQRTFTDYQTIVTHGRAE